MSGFVFQNGVLAADGLALTEIAATYGTPCYVYSKAAIVERYRAFEAALAGLDSRICFAVKANGNLGVLGVLADLGSGFDIVSAGELERVITAGGDPARVVFSGVGKRRDELERALEVGVGCFNVESESELHRLDEVAGRAGRRAPISIRVNPDVDAKDPTPYIATGLKDNKFGVDIARAEQLYADAAELAHIDILGVDCHIGSQLTDTAPFADAAARMVALIDRLAERGIVIRHLDIGGGLGICYSDEAPPSIADYVSVIRDAIGKRELAVFVEPGRAIVGNAGVLLTRVDTLKPGAGADDRSFAVVDAAINDLIRPALYDAWHDIRPVDDNNRAAARRWDIVGPICETGDFLGLDRELALDEGDLLAVYSAGAYGATMSSTYNARPRAPEIMVADGTAHVVRERETVADLMRGERRLAFD